MGYGKWSDADLSAYLDGQLSSDQARALESALQGNIELKARLEGLQNVAAMMRALPAREAPRNYLLTPAMVTETPPDAKPAKRYRAPLFMRLATSLVAAAFVVVMGLNVYMSGAISSMPMMMQDGAVPEMAAEEEMYAVAVVEEPAGVRELVEEEPPMAMEPEQDEASVEVMKEAETAMEIQPEAEEMLEEETTDDDTPLEVGIGGGGSEDENMEAATLLPGTVAPGTATAAAPVEEIEESVAMAPETTGEEADAAFPEATPEPITANAEPTATPAPTAWADAHEESEGMPEESEYDQPVVESWPRPRVRVLDWLPWMLGSATLLLGIVTWRLGRRRR